MAHAEKIWGGEIRRQPDQIPKNTTVPKPNSAEPNNDDEATSRKTEAVDPHEISERAYRLWG